MADADEDIIPKNITSTTAVNLDDGDISDETQDFRLISNLVSYDSFRMSFPMLINRLQKTTPNYCSKAWGEGF